MNCGAMNLATVCLFVKRSKGRVIFKAKRDALLGLPKMWCKRQAIQKNRLATVRAKLPRPSGKRLRSCFAAGHSGKA